MSITSVSPTRTSITCQDFSTWETGESIPEGLRGLIQSISDTVRDVVEGVTSEFHNIIGGSFSITKHSVAAPQAGAAADDDDEGPDEDDEDEGSDDEPEDPPRFQFSAN